MNEPGVVPSCVIFSFVSCVAARRLLLEQAAHLPRIVSNARRLFGVG